MDEVVFFLEEESAKALLEYLFPSLIPKGSDVQPRFIVFEGKQDLDKQLQKKLRGYLNPHARFIILRDQDQSDCRGLKKDLLSLCGERQPQPIVCIACHELEAFYLGDLLAVESGLGITGLSAKQNKAKFRDPDHLPFPSRELEKLTGNRFHKVAGSRDIAPHLNLEAPRSRSFHNLLKAIRDASQNLHERGAVGAIKFN